MNRLKKQLFLRGLLGFPIGISIGYVFTIIFSIIYGDGNYYPCVPLLAKITGNQISAVIIQTIFCGLIGSSFSATSIVWENEKWSIAKQTGVYFIINSFILLPIAYFLHWMEHSILGFISYLLIFTVIFILIWSFEYFIWKIRIKKINQRIKKD